MEIITYDMLKINITEWQWSIMFETYEMVKIKHINLN